MRPLAGQLVLQVKGKFLDRGQLLHHSLERQRHWAGDIRGIVECHQTKVILDLLAQVLQRLLLAAQVKLDLVESVLDACQHCLAVVFLFLQSGFLGFGCGQFFLGWLDQSA